MRTRTTVPSLALLLVSGLLAACGGGGDDDGVASLSGDGSDAGGATSTTLSEEEQQEALLDWAECMREHGIDMPDPEIGEDGGVSIMIGGGPGEDGGGDEGDDGGGPPGAADREAFQTAQEECGDPPMIGTFTEEDREQMEEDALAFSECMRDEGIEDFPDPDFSDFGPGRGPVTNDSESTDDADTNGDGEVRAVFGPWGEIDLEDPEIAAAFEACQEEMGGGPGGRVMGPPTEASEGDS